MLTTEAPVARLNRAAFFEDLGYKPHAGQWLVHRSKARRRVLVCGVRWGKSRCAAMEALAAAMEPRLSSIGWIVGPTYELAERVFQTIVAIVGLHLRDKIVELNHTDRRLVIRNMAGGLSEIRAKSADNPISLLGEGLDWVVVDEAARLKPVIFETYLSPRLLEKKGWALLISTPNGKNWFYDAFRRGQDGRDPGYESWNMPSSANPLLDPADIETERRRIPERVFRQEYLGEFLEGSGQIFRNVRDVATGEFKEHDPRLSYSIGIDLAKSEDYSVVVVVNSNLDVVYVDRFNEMNWSLQFQRMKVASERYKRPVVYVDSTGAGEPIAEAMRREAGLRVSPFVITAQSKVNLIGKLQLLFDQKKVVLPRPELWPEGIEELEAFEYTVTESGHTNRSAPPGYHDDCVIALALAVWGVRPPSAHCGVRFL